MLKEKAIKYYDKSYNLNCAETIIYAANEEYNLNLDKNTLKTMAAFGGGMGIESICGAATGALAVLGILFTKDRSHESDKIKLLSGEFMNKFKDKLQTNICSELKSRYKNDEIRCSHMIITASEILEEIINRENNK